MFYGKPLHIAYASPRSERSRLVPDNVARSYSGPPGDTDHMKLLEKHLNGPLDRSRAEDPPKQGVAAASDGMAQVNPSSKSSPRNSWERYGLKENI
jgi:hypothetical protein